MVKSAKVKKDAAIENDADAPLTAPSGARNTRAAIIDAAELVLRTHGYSRFTLKLIADTVGISVGNLTYHFRTKEILLKTLIEQCLEEYSARFQAMAEAGDLTSPAALINLLEWVMDDSTSKIYTYLFRELWAVSLHEPLVRKALDNFYERSVSCVVELMPDLTVAAEQKIRSIVYLICTLSEGSTVLFGARPEAREQFREVKALARQAIEDLIRNDELLL